MRITGVENCRNYKSSVNFGRKLRGDEKKACEQDIKAGLDVLGKNMGIILPTNCAPSISSKDIGIGQAYSTSSDKMLLPFVAQWGYSEWQQEPGGLRKPTDPSPYVSNSSAYNTLLIDLEDLTKEENGKILSSKTYTDIVKNNPTKGKDKSSYSYSVQQSKKALDEAFKTFDYKKSHLDELDDKERAGIEKLNNDFEAFKTKYGAEQEKNALYSVLTDIYDNDYWPNWSSETDRNLFDSPKPNEESKKRLKELRKEHGKEIESFMFSQMLAKKSIDEGSRKAEQQGIKPKADIPVALSDAQVWGNKHLFLKDMRMGCHEPWSDQPQRWGFYVLDPDQMFNENGTLGPAGKFLYNKYEKVFEENKGGVRIDHIVGLMDPYVYNEKDPEKGGRLYSELYRGKNGDPNKCDRILRKIVLPAAKAAGLSSSAIIAEDLGYMPNKTKEALYNLGIGGTSVTQWMNAHEVWNAPENNAIMVANHDTAPARELYPDKNERRNKFIELFSSGAKNIQIFWTDMLGIKERYNVPGQSGDKNWALRMPSNFEDVYHNRLERGEALNIPDVIVEANRRRNPNFSHEHKELFDNLKHWSKVLKEKEE